RKHPMLNTRALEGFIVAFVFSDRGRLFVRVHVSCSQLIQSHISCPHNRGKANTVKLVHGQVIVAKCCWAENSENPLSARFYSSHACGALPSRRMGYWRKHDFQD